MELADDKSTGFNFSTSRLTTAAAVGTGVEAVEDEVERGEAMGDGPMGCGVVAAAAAAIRAMKELWKKGEEKSGLGG